MMIGIVPGDVGQEAARMAGEVRQRMIDGAIALLATRGLEGTSFATVLARTGAPRGSVYHHFPGGKDELVGAAVEANLGRALDLLDAAAGSSAIKVAEVFLGAWRALLTQTDFRAGCALVAVTVGTDSAELKQRTADAFRAWRDHLAGLLEQGGLPRAAAQRHAALLLSASEGAVVISRALGDLSTFEAVSASLLDGIRRDLG
jgi:TetR/AcrR family transcriptional regulator, lmrAB and yxaGH operons repressor